jgi:hypothetical protein
MALKGFCISIPFTHWTNISNKIRIKFWGCLYNRYELIDVSEFLLQSSFRNSIEFYYNWILILCIMYDVWCVMTGLYIISCLCIYVLWHVLHPMASFSQKRIYVIKYIWMNEWWIAHIIFNFYPKGNTSFYIKENHWLITSKVIITTHAKNRAKSLNTLCGYDVKIFNIKTDNTHRHQFALKWIIISKKKNIIHVEIPLQSINKQAKYATQTLTRCRRLYVKMRLRANELAKAW